VLTVRLYAERKGWALDRIETRLTRDPGEGKINSIELELLLGGDLTGERHEPVRGGSRREQADQERGDRTERTERDPQPEALLREIARAGGAREALCRVVEPIEGALAAARARATSPRTRVFCPIWKQPWMAVGSDTYAHDLIELCGGFSPVWSGKIIEAIAYAVPVGVVAYGPESISGMYRLFPD